MKTNIYILLAAMMLSGIGSFAQQDPKTDETVTLNQYGQEVESVPLDADNRSGILTFESKDKNYKFWFDNRVYFDGAFFSNKVYNPIGNGAMIRRARFAVKANMWKNWYGEVDVDFAGSVIELKDAYVKYTFDSDNVNIKAGHFRESFGMETLTTSRYVTFIERSFMAKLDPSRHLGVQANYWDDTFLVTGGIHFNTVGDSEEVIFSQDANKDFGVDEGYAYTGRFVYKPINDKEKVLHLGVAATHRTPQTTEEVTNSYRFSTRSHTSINRKKYIDTDNILNVANMNMFDFELAASYKGWMFQGEYKIANINRRNDLSSVTLDGHYLQAGYLLFGGKYNYNGEDGEFTRITRGKKYGELEIAARYDYINANDFDAGIYGGSAEGYTFGLNYHFNPNVKFMLNYCYNNHDRYANGKAKLFVGHDINGNLTKESADVVEAKGKAGEDFGQLQMRVEIDF